MTPQTPTPLKTTELARYIGCSAKFLRDEIASGHLKAIRVGRGNKVGSHFAIPYREAVRYCKQLGLEPPFPAIEKAHKLLADRAFIMKGETPAFISWDGEIRLCNPAMCRLLNRREEEVLGKHPVTLIGLDRPIKHSMDDIADIREVTVLPLNKPPVPVRIARVAFIYEGRRAILSIIHPAYQAHPNHTKRP